MTLRLNLNPQQDVSVGFNNLDLRHITPVLATNRTTSAFIFDEDLLPSRQTENRQLFGMGAPSAQGASVANAAKPRPSRKRQLIDLTNDEDENDQTTPKKRPNNLEAESKSSTREEKSAKRPRRWRNHPPAAYTERLERAMSQRMFVLDRQRRTASGPPHEEITMAGTTGNVYTISIDTIPSCTCPDAAKKNQCKHIIYALTRILKAPAELRYQLSFLPDELASIFAASPLVEDKISKADADSEHPNNRKPIAGDCPICFCDMADDEPKDIVWCKAACGNNLHKICFAQWERSSRSTSGKVRCVYCRADWQSDGVAAGAEAWTGSPEELAALKTNATVDGDGYVNIASQLGLSGHRDYSSYHQPWVNSRRWGGRGRGSGG